MQKQTSTNIGFVIATSNTELNSRRSMTTLSQEANVTKQDQCRSSSDVNDVLVEQATVWDSTNQNHVMEAKDKLQIWPLDEYNTILLNEVHPVNYNNNNNTTEQKPHVTYKDRYIVMFCVFVCVDY
jgi:hypothetical protein